MSRNTDSSNFLDDYNDPKSLDRQGWAESVDSDLIRLLDQTLIRDQHCIFGALHGKLHCFSFRMFIAIFFGVIFVKNK